MQSFLPHQTFGGARGPLDSPAFFRTIFRSWVLPFAHATFFNRIATEKATVDFRCNNNSFWKSNPTTLRQIPTRTPRPGCNKFAAMAAPQKGYAPNLEKFLKSLKGRQLDASVESLIS